MTRVTGWTRIGTTAVAAVLATAGTVVPLAATAAAAETVRFGCTHAPRTYVVPSDARSLAITAAGASGGLSETWAGYGGMVTGTIDVAAGTSLTVVVGCADGYNGGGGYTINGYNNGGGASDVRLGGTALAHRVIVAGGGGGEGGGLQTAAPGGAGGLVGLPAPDGRSSTTGALVEGGDGASQRHGGEGGYTSQTGTCTRKKFAQDGELGTGGAGAFAESAFNPSFRDAGGGGGGLYGGGGGDATCTGGAGGGGGSSDGPAGSVFATGVNFGDGYVEITPLPTRSGTAAVPAQASDDCAAAGATTETFAPGVYLATAQPDPATAWVCVRATVQAIGTGYDVDTGGKFVVSTAPGSSPGLPTTDGNAAACASTPGNTVPGPHPLLAGAVGDPGDPATYLPYLLDAYGNASATWVCVRVGDVQRRVVVPTPGTLLPPVVTFVPDPAAPFDPPAPAPLPPAPSTSCPTPWFDTTVGDFRAYVGTGYFPWIDDPLEPETKLCVGVRGPVSAGGALVIDVADDVVVPPTVTTSTTDMTPCTVQVLHNVNPAISVRRSPTGAYPASVCVEAGGQRLRVTVDASTGGGEPVTVTWTPDPGTPGLP
jgi:hypothetical protein